MNGKHLFVMIFSLVFLSFNGVAHGWQGRMAGMGDPFGLVEDESDYLIHPSLIADGEGVKFYGDYRFTYRDVMDWDYTLEFRPAGGTYQYRTSGNESEHDARLGVAFPLAAGRMGLFFNYSGRRGDYDGLDNQLLESITNVTKYSLDSKLDAYALRILYGLPIGIFKLGGEVQLAYRHDENITFFSLPGYYPPEYSENLLDRTGYDRNLFPFMFPYDSKYWETLFKGSIEGTVGSAKIALTVRGGFIFEGDNTFNQFYAETIGFSPKGQEIKGYNLGSDLFLRYPLKKDLSLPFILDLTYRKKTRDEDLTRINENTSLEEKIFLDSKEETFHVEMGGGIDKEFNKGMRVAAEISYGYLWSRMTFKEFQSSYSVAIGAPAAPATFDHLEYPDHTEHQVIVRLIGEKQFSPQVAVRMGLKFFYGWVNEDFKFSGDQTNTFGFISYRILNTERISLDGYHWGMNASLGSTLKFGRLTIEPFIVGGYQRIDLDGDGRYSGDIISGQAIGTGPIPVNFDRLKKHWTICGGLSILF